LDGFSAGTIQKSDLAGGGIQTLVTTGPDELAELELDPVDGKLFWTEFTSGLICESNLDGSGLQTLVSGLKDPRGLALDLPHGKMYWTELGDGSGARIQRANLDGSSQQLLFQGNTLNEPGGISVDSGAGLLYWVEPDKVQRSTVDGLGLTTIVSNVHASFAGDLVLRLQVPEPTTATLLLLGMLGYGGWRYR
jgi:Low-density lipoprotein receptor repeat class B/PEP-CTERM motif